MPDGGGGASHPATISENNPMKRLLLYLSYIVAATCSLNIAATPNEHSGSAAAEPETAIEWFRRANDLMNPRTLGSSPFRMKVVIHAFPGLELKKKQPEIVSGDGIYEETWLDPHQWRREVTLGSYHAIEVESAQGRKMQASADYEPSRVLSLLTELYNPIGQGALTTEYKDMVSQRWSIDQLIKDGVSFVRISQNLGNGRESTADAYYFQPHGHLFLQTSYSRAVIWEKYVRFADKDIPTHLTIKAGERELLTADVAIEAASKVDSSMFDLPGGVAEPGMTLRPLTVFQVKVPDLFGDMRGVGLSSLAHYAVQGVLDRQGRYREIEYLVGDRDQAEIPMSAMGKEAIKPATIDRSPCELMVQYAPLY